MCKRKQSLLCRQVWVLIRKNYLIKVRNLKETVFEFAFPLVLSLVTLIVNITQQNDYYDD